MNRREKYITKMGSFSYQKEQLIRHSFKMFTEPDRGCELQIEDVQKFMIQLLAGKHDDAIWSRVMKIRRNNPEIFLKYPDLMI